MKIKIAPESKNEQRPYEHLLPMVHLQLINGNEPSEPRGGHQSDEFGFYMNRDGWICVLQKPIDFGLVRREFELPVSIKLDEKKNIIFCERSWIEIRGNIDTN